MRRINENEAAIDVAQDHIGQTLKAARRAAGKSLSDVAQDLRIQHAYLTALERLDHDDLPSFGYVLGYLRSYALYLKLDPKTVIAHYKRDIQERGLNEAKKKTRKRAIRRLRVPRGTYAMGSVLGCVLVVFSWYGLQPDSTSAHMINDGALNGGPKAAGAQIMQTAQRATPIAQAKDESISIKAVGPSWVEILDDSGDVLVSRILVPGEIITTERSLRPVISARDGGALELYVGGERVGLLGEQGQFISEFSLLPTGK